MHTLFSPSAPAAIGPYSHAIRTGNLLFLSGQIGLDPETGLLIDDDIARETEQACKNIAAILQTAGIELMYVVKTTIFLTDMSDFGEVNTVYERYFSHKPARSTIAVAELPKGAKIEIECIAEIR